MISPRSRWTTLALGSLAMASVAGTARSDGLERITDRCAVYGPGFVDLGNGTCGHVSRRIETQPNGWSGSSAALRSDGYAMMPGAGNARHLRVQVDPDFR